MKSAMDKVSNTPLKLTVEVKYVSGLFSLNVPPPPTDRIWCVMCYFNYYVTCIIIIYTAPSISPGFSTHKIP